ncbi:hypothetical protein MBLNU13_g05244t1 [Cladosporium sp. NU13]
MADPRPRPDGEIIDHPAFENFEALQLFSEPFAALQARDPEYSTPELWEQLITGWDVFPNVLNDRFLVHEPNLVLENGPDEDPLEVEDGHVSDEGLQCDLEIDDMLQIRRENHCHNLIAAGFRPERSVRNYKISPDMFAGTSLEVPELLNSGDSGPPQCRAQRAEELSFRGLTPEAFQELIEEAKSERERTQELELDLEGCEHRLQFEKSKLVGLKARILNLAVEWRKKDAQAYSKWERHLSNAHNASESPCRIFQIAFWYTKGDVPDKLWDAVRDLAQRELIAPEGKGGAALAQHIMANLETRRIRCEHSINLNEKDEDFKKDKATTTALRVSFSKFITKAQKMVEGEVYKLLGDDPSLPTPNSQPWADHQALVDVEKALFAASHQNH